MKPASYTQQSHNSRDTTPITIQSRRAGAKGMTQNRQDESSSPHATTRNEPTVPAKIMDAGFVNGTTGSSLQPSIPKASEPNTTLYKPDTKAQSGSKADIPWGAKRESVACQNILRD